MKAKRKHKKSPGVGKRWQLQEAKAKFSELFDRALKEGPQRVSRREKDTVVVMKEEDFDRLAGGRRKPTIMEALLAAPRMEGFTIPRSGALPRPPEGFE